MQLPVHVDLALCDVASQIRDGMGDVVVGHRQDRDLSDGAVAAGDTASALIDCGQICVHVTGEATTTGNLFSGG